jgi:cyclophilin family peptidyl-prolyl cis-trans isomerase
VVTDATADGIGVASSGVDWAESYLSAPLPESRITTLQAVAQSGDLAAATHAAFVLGRRAPRDRINALFNLMPNRVAPSFARAAAGRSREQQPESLPARLGALLSVAHPDPSYANWVYRSRKPLTGFAPGHLRTLAASARSEDQLTAARLLMSPSIDPPFDLVGYMHPVPMAVAFLSVSERNSTVPEIWAQWITATALRVKANPRAWGNTWRSLIENCPRQAAAVRTALLVALPLVGEARTGNAAVDAAFRCANALAFDVTNERLQAIPTCASGEHRWRAQVATAQYLRDTPNEPQRAELLQNLARVAHEDVRVLESIPPAAVRLPPSVAVPLLSTLAQHRDPGVLASLLEQLALHVQHARALPSSLRTRLIQSPFSLDEGPSIEARLQAIALAHALGVPVPSNTGTLRAIRQALQPDAALQPAPSIAAPSSTRETLVITTQAGVIRITLDSSWAPEAVALVRNAVLDGRYNSTTFHRVVPAFVAQGGDPRGDGYGGAMTLAPTELSGQRFERGAVGIALSGLDTGGMQFFIMMADSPHLDARYPWIGRVSDGMAVVDELMVGDVMERVELAPGSE